MGVQAESGLTCVQLDVLLRAYEVEREADTDALSGIYALLAGYFTLLSGIGVALTLSNVPRWTVAILPILPVPIAAFGAIHAYSATVRGRVIRTYEMKLRQAGGWIATDDIGRVPFPVGHFLVDALWRGPVGVIGVGASTITLSGLYVGALVASYQAAHKAEPALSVVSVAGSAVLMLLIASVYLAAISPVAWIKSAISPLR